MSPLMRIAALALFIAAAIWFASATEWVETEETVPPRGEAARDSLYAARKLLASLGIDAHKRSTLDTMPPPGARLLLTSSNWSMFPGRGAQLQAWVQRGGHLVLPARIGDREDFTWLPVATKERPKHDEDAPAPAGSRPRDPDEARCRALMDAGQKLQVCGWPYWRELTAKADTAVAWRLEGPNGLEAVRVALGQGSVTVVGPLQLFDNRELLRADNPLLFARAMQAERGAQAWLVAEESREQLVLWVWREGWVALVMVLLALAAGLWRSAVRFGPLAAPALAQRRSMAEQVIGTARFLRKHGAKALLQAQQRAVHETANAQVPGYASADAARRASLLAARTGLPESDITAALHAKPLDERKLSASLGLLETVRRRLHVPFHSKQG